MASDVDICNLALSYLGDTATVASINPPEGSPQASHCATFYPIARDALFEMHDWGFATKRVALAQLDNPSSQWAYCYAAPSDLMNTIAVLDAAALDDTIQTVTNQDQPIGYTNETFAQITPQPYSVEMSADGQDIIYTNQANAVFRYVARIIDTTKFSPLFVRTLAASLASMLAGPVLKGEAGARASLQWHAVAFGQDGNGGWFKLAATSDAGQKRSTFRNRQPSGWTR